MIRLCIHAMDWPFSCNITKHFRLHQNLKWENSFLEGFTIHYFLMLDFICMYTYYIYGEKDAYYTSPSALTSDKKFCMNDK